MSVLAFASHTKLGATTITDIEAKGGSARLRLTTQRILDEVLAAAPEQARQRFRAATGEALLLDPDVSAGPDTREHAIASREATDDMDRRSVLATGGMIALNAALPPPAPRTAGMGVLGAVAWALTGPATQAGQQRPGPGHRNGDLAPVGAALKRRYQAGQYREAARELPDLLRLARTVVSDAADGDRRLPLVAGIYQTACSVMLKLGDGGLAMLAADRSMAAARRSGDLLAAGASARALAHALTNGGHHDLAATVALDMAKRLQPGRRPARLEELAVYGALLLRASVVAAAAEDRRTALTALAEARETTVRLGNDENAYWTYFCPINVSLHQVSVAVRLGDAGQALEHARQIDPQRISLAERRACFYAEIARACLLWNKHSQAYEALRAAERIAPEEITARPEVRELVVELQRRCPSSIYGRVSELASRVAG